MRVLKYLRGHIPAVALIVLLLVAQSFCELSLPAYTSPSELFLLPNVGKLLSVVNT